jgi:hypothetical protein
MEGGARMIGKWLIRGEQDSQDLEEEMLEPEELADP